MTKIAKIFEPKINIPDERKKFNGKALAGLIIPLVLQDLLNCLVGLADSAMVTHVSEEAVSGVTLVNTLNYIPYLIFTAVASGGAVIASQYVGRKDKENADKAAGQLVLIVSILAIFISALVLILREPIFDLIYRKVESDVRTAGLRYLNITAYSFIFLALNGAFSALLRSMGKTKVILYVSIVMNLSNIAGNAIGIFVLNADVDGVAFPTLISRALAAIGTGIAICQKDQIQLKFKNIIRVSRAMIKRILSIAVPCGIESGAFQIAKVATTSFVTYAGTSHIAAYGVTGDFWAISCAIGTAMNMVFVTVVGQYMGAGDVEGAEYYMKKLLRIAVFSSAAWNVIVGLVSPLALYNLYSISDETRNIAIILIYLHVVLYSFIGPFAFALSSGLQATGDVKFTLISVMIGTLVVRTVMSYVLGVVFGLGAIGVTLAMILDWIVKGTLIYIRFRKGKWKTHKVI